MRPLSPDSFCSSCCLGITSMGDPDEDCFVAPFVSELPSEGCLTSGGCCFPRWLIRSRMMPPATTTNIPRIMLIHRISHQCLLILTVGIPGVRNGTLLAMFPVLRLGYLL